MKTMKKKLILAMALTFTASILLPTAASCSPAVDNSENTLEIFVTNAGYGTKWLTDTIAAFKEEAWVKEKYPELNIPTPKMNSMSDYIPTQITMGEKNTVDLFFSCQAIGAYYNSKDSKGNPYFEDFTELLTTVEIPGEGVTMAQKMNAQIYEEEKIELLNGGEVYYAIPWVNGMMGLMYNKTRVDELLGENYIMPRTTEELISCTAALKAKLPEGDAPFIFSNGSRYFNAPFIVWWSQYEGKQQYLNYWNGVDEEGEYTNEIFAQTGRYRALDVYEKLINRDLGNNHSMSTTDGYYKIQSNYVAGQAGIFMPIGDWLMTEMEGALVTEEIRMMKMPVISTITEKCTSVKNDTQLAFVVQSVDEGKDYTATAAAYADAGYGELKSADYTKISQARNMMYRMTGHEAFVPAYATGKEVAKDFLLFMASDKGIEAFMNATKGTMTPYNYEVSATKLDSFYPLQQDHYEYMKTVVSLPPENVFKLNYLGGLQQVTKNVSVEVPFAAQNKNDRLSAWDVYQADIKFYTQSQYELLLQKAGIR